MKITWVLILESLVLLVADVGTLFIVFLGIFNVGVLLTVVIKPGRNLEELEDGHLIDRSS